MEESGLTLDARRLKREDTLLLLVDLQPSMLELCQEAERVRTSAAALIEMAALFGLPVVLSEHNASRLGGFLPGLVEQAGNARLLNKMEFSCFDNAQIRSAIAAAGRRTLLIAGIETHLCIFQTAVGALRQGYGVHVVADGTAARRLGNHEIGLKRLERAGAVLNSVEMALFELLRRAGTQEFRRALPLIKSF